MKCLLVILILFYCIISMHAVFGSVTYENEPGVFSSDLPSVSQGGIIPNDLPELINSKKGTENEVYSSQDVSIMAFLAGIIILMCIIFNVTWSLIFNLLIFTATSYIVYILIVFVLESPQSAKSSQNTETGKTEAEQNKIYAKACQILYTSSLDEFKTYEERYLEFHKEIDTLIRQNQNTENLVLKLKDLKSRFDNITPHYHLFVLNAVRANIQNCMQFEERLKQLIKALDKKNEEASVKNFQAAIDEFLNYNFEASSFTIADNVLINLRVQLESLNDVENIVYGLKEENDKLSAHIDQLRDIIESIPADFDSEMPNTYNQNQNDSNPILFTSSDSVYPPAYNPDS